MKKIDVRRGSPWNHDFVQLCENYWCSKHTQSLWTSMFHSLWQPPNILKQCPFLVSFPSSSMMWNALIGLSSKEEAYPVLIIRHEGKEIRRVLLGRSLFPAHTETHTHAANSSCWKYTYKHTLICYWWTTYSQTTLQFSYCYISSVFSNSISIAVHNHSDAAECYFLNKSFCWSETVLRSRGEQCVQTVMSLNTSSW